MNDGSGTIVPVTLRDVLTGAVVMGPMTKGSNLPYPRLAIELGARVTMSEMAGARRLKQKRRSEFALIRRAPGEPFFGVQLAGTNPEEMAWAAALVEARGADFVDVNLDLALRRTRDGKLSVHFLNLATVQRGETEFPAMDPYPAVGPFAVRLRVPQKPAAVRWEPEGPKVGWSWREGILTATIPSVQIHGALVVE